MLVGPETVEESLAQGAFPFALYTGKMGRMHAALDEKEGPLDPHSFAEQARIVDPS